MELLERAGYLDDLAPGRCAHPPIPAEILASLFEAARWAPSCFNEEPWLFLYASTEEDLWIYRPLLIEKNRVWADRAPVLAFVFTRRAFAKSGEPNRWAAFDAVAARMCLALEARKRGLYTHGMAGFHLGGAQKAEERGLRDLHRA